MLSRFTKMFTVAAISLILVTSLFVVHPPSRTYLDPWTGSVFGEGGVEPHDLDDSHDHLHSEGHVIMPKLGNATAKAQLGQATWKLIHTMTLRFPESPTPDERQALKSYFFLLSRLYPCGECASEFQLLLKKYPPQTSSRKTASLWLCFVHNQVNERLKKPEFDCSKLDSTYDCGCGDDPNAAKTNTTEVSRDLPADFETKDELTGVDLIRGG